MSPDRATLIARTVCVELTSLLILDIPFMELHPPSSVSPSPMALFTKFLSKVSSPKPNNPNQGSCKAFC